VVFGRDSDGRCDFLQGIRHEKQSMVMDNAATLPRCGTIRPRASASDPQSTADSAHATMNAIASSRSHLNIELSAGPCAHSAAICLARLDRPAQGGSNRGLVDCDQLFQNSSRDSSPAGGIFPIVRASHAPTAGAWSIHCREVTRVVCAYVPPMSLGAPTVLHLPFPPIPAASPEHRSHRGNDASWNFVRLS